MQLERVQYSVSYWDATHHNISVFHTVVDLDGDYVAELKKAMDSELSGYNLYGSILCNAYRDQRHGFAKLDLKESD